MPNRARLSLPFFLLLLVGLLLAVAPAMAEDTPNPDDVAKDGATDLGDSSSGTTGSTGATGTTSPPAADAPKDPPKDPAPPAAVDMAKIRQQAEEAVPPVANVIDLSALDAAGQVYGQMKDIVAQWVATLPGNRDQWGNEITGGYQNARQPDFVPDELKRFIQQYLKEHPEQGKQVALSPGEADSMRRQFADERNGKIVAEMERLAEEARKTAAEDAAKAAAEGQPKGEATGDPSEGGDGAKQPEDTPDLSVPDGNIGEDAGDVNPGGEDTADEDIRVPPDEATAAKLEEAYGIDVVGDWPQRQLRLLATSLQLMPKSWCKGIKVQLSSQDNGGVAGFYTPANKTATFLPRGQGNLHCYTHEIMHHAGLANHPQKLQQFMRVLGWVPDSSGKGVYRGEARNFPSNYAKVNPYEHAAEAMSYYLERKDECRQRFTKEVCDYLDQWIGQG